jgi:hypothetical protein
MHATFQLRGLMTAVKATRAVKEHDVPHPRPQKAPEEYCAKPSGSPWSTGDRAISSMIPRTGPSPTAIVPD